MPDYLVPKWFDIRKLDLARLSDVDLKAYDVELLEVERWNRKLYDEARKKYNVALAGIIELYGERSDAVKYMRRKHIQLPPDHRSEHQRWKNKVYRERKKAEVARREAIKSEARRAKQRAYSKRYYAKLKQERCDWLDALKLEGFTERELWQLTMEEESMEQVS